MYEPDLKKYVNTTKDNLSVILRFDETVGYKASTSSTSSTSEMTIQEANNILAGKKQAVSFEEIEEARAVLGVTLLGNPVYKGFKNKKLLDE